MKKSLFLLISALALLTACQTGIDQIIPSLRLVPKVFYASIEDTQADGLDTKVYADAQKHVLGNADDRISIFAMSGRPVCKILIRRGAQSRITIWGMKKNPEMDTSPPPKKNSRNAAAVGEMKDKINHHQKWIRRAPDLRLHPLGESPEESRRQCTRFPSSQGVSTYVFP